MTRLNKSGLHDIDGRLMARAIQLSSRGFPAPNPHVGCVLAHGDEIVGEGFHRFAGGPHAEIEALRSAGERAAGSTAFVTLEPCNHHGRTPPCVDALIEARIKRVVVACLDPNPKAAGGLARLSDAGIQTEAGLLRQEAATHNIGFLFAMANQRPYITIKAAASLDGRIALPSGESKWITGPSARKTGHRLRAEMGAVLVGRGTVEADDPLLHAALPGVYNQPVRVVLDPSGRLGSQWRVFDMSAPTFHVTNGWSGLCAGLDGFDLHGLAHRLFERGVTGLLVEGGSRTTAGFVKAGLVDRIELFLAPKLLGDGLAWVEGLNLSRLGDAPEYRLQSVKKLSGDVHITLVR